LAKKQVRKNYYKNSRVRRRQRIIRRCLLGLKTILLVGGIAGTSLLLILAYDAVTQSSYFEARTITVEGNQRYSKETILKQAGLKLHDNILSLNLNTLRYRLMARPWIAGAEVERELPDAVHIRVRERVPIAIVNLNRPARVASEGVEGRLFYLDEEGEIFKPVESSDKVRVPVVTGLALSDIDFNDQSRSLLFRAVMEVLRLSRLHQNVILLRALHSIHVDRQVGLTLYALPPPYNLSTTPDRAPVLAGKANRGIQADRGAVAIKVGFGDYGSKYRRLRDMIPYLEKESGFLNVQSIDLNDSDRVVVRHSLAGQAVRRAVSGGWDFWPNRRKGV
jgi:cell division protein FtsQ